MPEMPPLPADYPTLLKAIRQRVRHAQTRAVMAVNAELIRLYWEIGVLIDQRQQQEGWGAAVIPRLARDLHNELPEEKGFSERNIKRMLAFHRAYPNVVPQVVAQKGNEPEAPQPMALFPPDLLLALPWGHHSELLANGFHKRELETGLAIHLEKFLLELGQGFAFVGRQVLLTVGSDAFLSPPCSITYNCAF